MSLGVFESLTSILYGLGIALVVGYYWAEWEDTIGITFYQKHFWMLFAFGSMVGMFMTVVSL